MFNMDRWLKRLLALLILGTGACGGRNAALAPDTTRGTPVTLRAVRFSTPLEIWGTKTRVVVVRYGSGQLAAGFGSGSDMRTGESYSSGRRRGGGSDGPMVNLIFLSGMQPGHVLLDKPAYVDGFDYPTTKSDSLQRWIVYRIALGDTNKDGLLDSGDQVDLYVSNLDGSNLRRVLPPGMRFLNQDPVGDGRRIIVTALQVPNDWRGSDDELRERAFLYDVQTGATTPHAGLDSLVQKAARVVGRQ
jgi:hypothetical protein